MTVFRSGDEVEHVGADEQRTKLLEVAVLLVLDCCRGGEWISSSRRMREGRRARRTLGDSPEVLATLDGAAVGGGDILGRSDDGEGHGSLFERKGEVSSVHERDETEVLLTVRTLACSAEASSSASIGGV